MKTRRIVCLFALSLVFVACLFSSAFAQSLRKIPTGSVSKIQGPQLKLPDVIVESINVPGQPKEGDKVQNIVVKIRNQGTGASLPGKLRMSCEPTDHSCTCNCPDSLHDKSYPLPQIPAGASESITIPSGPTEVWKAKVFKITATLENNKSNSVEVSVVATVHVASALSAGASGASAVAQLAKITSIRGTVSGVVNGKSVVDYFGGCDKITLKVENANHVQAEPVTCTAVPGQNYCAFNETLDNPHYFNAIVPSPAGYVATWNYSCNFPGSNPDRICDITLKDIASTQQMQNVAQINSPAASALLNGPNLKVQYIAFQNPQVNDANAPYFAGMLIDARYGVINNGNQSSPEATVRIDLAKKPYGSPTVSQGLVTPLPALAPKATYEAKFKTTVTNCDTDGIKVIIDPGNLIQELNKDDNTLFYPFGGATQYGQRCFADQAAYQKSLLPDVSLRGLHFAPHYLDPSRWDLVFIVENLNMFHSGFPATKAALYTNGQKVTEFDITDAGTYSFYLLTQPQCGQQYTITLDPDNLVNEQDKSNNSQTTAFVCKF